MSNRRLPAVDKITVGLGGSLHLEFRVTPVQDPEWEENFMLVCSTDPASDRPPSIAVLPGTGNSYTIWWPDGPQNIRDALRAIDNYVEAANALTGSTRVIASDRRD